jgi:hypothetical protein
MEGEEVSEGHQKEGEPCETSREATCKIF